MRNVQQHIVVLLLMLVTACGGGGTLDSGTGGGGSTAVYSLAITLTDSAGAAATALAQATPLTITATLTATNGGNIANQVINFALSDPSLAVLGNTAGTVLTNSSGVATINLLVGSKSGAGTVTATFADATASTGFTSAGDGGDTVDGVVGSVVLIADSLLLGSGASAKVELTALVRDPNNVVVADIPVTFAIDSGELVQVDALTTANGTAKATLTTQTDKNNRDITVTARVQQQVSQLMVAVSGTSVEVAAPHSVVLGDTTTIDIFLTDSNDIGIANTEIEVSSALGNTLSDTSPETAGSAGKATFTYTAVNSGADTLTVSALGAADTVTLNVSADEFAFVTVADEAAIPEVHLNTAGQLEVEWLVNGAANAGQHIIFNTTRGAIADTAANLANGVTAAAVTDANGLARAMVRSQFAGLATINANGGTGPDAVSANKVIEFVAVNPSQIETQAFPAQLGAGESSAIRAIVRDVNNNPVKNQTVVFSLDNAAGGVISTGTALTNSQGIASTVFTADTNTGGGVASLNLVVKAALQSNNAISDATDIAIGQRTLFFRFGTGNVITKAGISTYATEFSVIVTDSSGNPVANQLLNIAVLPIGYRKGVWVAFPPAPAAFKLWQPDITAGCVNEDANLNGILDPGEDVNQDGLLTPGNVAVVPRTVSADDNGIATFLITYPQDYAPWTDVRLQVSGFAAGTENVAYRNYTLPVPSEDLTTETAAPPVNPLGFAASCAIAE